MSPAWDCKHLSLDLDLVSNQQTSPRKYHADGESLTLVMLCRFHLRLESRHCWTFNDLLLKAVPSWSSLYKEGVSEHCCFLLDDFEIVWMVGLSSGVCRDKDAFCAYCCQVVNDLVKMHYTQGQLSGAIPDWKIIKMEVSI